MLLKILITISWWVFLVILTPAVMLVAAFSGDDPKYSFAPYLILFLYGLSYLAPILYFLFFKNTVENDEDEDSFLNELECQGLESPIHCEKCSSNRLFHCMELYICSKCGHHGGEKWDDLPNTTILEMESKFEKWKMKAAKQKKIAKQKKNARQKK